MVTEIMIRPLEELCDQVVDCPHSTPAWTDEGIVVLRSSNIKSGRLDLSNPSFTDVTHYEERSRRAVVRGGDVVITREAPMGEVCLIPDGLKCCLGQRMVLLRPSSDVCHGKYLLYALQSRQVQNEIRSHDGTGSTVSNLRIPVLKGLSIPAPSLNQQKSIAAILGALDDKIEIIRKTKQALEDIAKTLFKSWFVDFEPARAKAGGRPTGLPNEISEMFPDSLEDSELGEIPSGWSIGSAGEHLELIKGRSYKSAELQESTTALVTLKSFQRGGGYREDGLKPYVGSFKEEQVIRPGELVIALTDVTQAADVIGRPAIVRTSENSKTLVASLDVGIIRKKKHGMLPQAFTYELFRTDNYVSHALSYTSGTTVLHLDKDVIDDFQVVIPPLPLIDAFTSFSTCILERIDISSQQSGTLEKLRDALLERLITGELRIPDAERMLEEVGI